MKRFLIIIMVFILVASLAACGGKTEDTSQETEATEEAKTEETKDADDTAGKIFESEEFTVVVPDGWFAHEMFKDGVAKTDQVNIVKGTEDPFEAFDYPLITLSYGGPSMTLLPVSKDFYEGAEDIDPVEIGGKTFKGFKAITYDRPLVCLFAEDGEKQYQAAMWTKTSKGEFTLEDEDVVKILESFIGK